jgi:hypothetical protein
MSGQKEYTETEVRLIIEGAIAAEREACAKLCDRGDPRVKAAMTQFECAQAIRKRGTDAA